MVYMWKRYVGWVGEWVLKVCTMGGGVEGLAMWTANYHTRWKDAWLLDGVKQDSEGKDFCSL